MPPLQMPAAERDVEAVLLGENGDELDALPKQLDFVPVYRTMGLSLAPRETILRRALIDRLIRAQRTLPQGFKLVVLDGWRSLEFQYELLQHYRSETGSYLEGYVSDPEDSHLTPPHTTGGAVDLTLSFQGRPLALGTDFDDFTERAHLGSLESVEPTEVASQDVLAKQLRRMLGYVLSTEGLAPYPLEWWHWSYGEQRWAAQHGRTTTLYSPVESNAEIRTF